MKKILKNTKKTRDYLDSLPRIYMVARWAGYGVTEFPFTGKYTKNKEGIDIPLVYNYEDCNGACDIYRLRRIDYTTTGFVFMWTQNKRAAFKIMDLLDKEVKDGIVL